MTHIVDARGLSCPQPVIMTKQAFDQGQFPIEVRVDTITSRENVRRTADRLGCKVEIHEEGEEYTLIITKP